MSVVIDIWGGYSGRGWIWTQRKKLEFDIWGGVFWERLDLNSEEKEFDMGEGGILGEVEFELRGKC